MKTYTIIDLATDREYTDTLKMLVYMIDNCNNTEERDYDIIVPRKLQKPVRINFESYLYLKELNENINKELV